MNGSLPLPPPTRQHQPYHCGYDSYDDYGYDYFTHRLIMHHSFDTRTPTKSGKPKKDGDMRDIYYTYPPRFGEVEGFPAGWMEEYRESWNLLQ